VLLCRLCALICHSGPLRMLNNASSPSAGTSCCAPSSFARNCDVYFLEASIDSTRYARSQTTLVWSYGLPMGYGDISPSDEEEKGPPSPTKSPLGTRVRRPPLANKKRSVKHAEEPPQTAVRHPVTSCVVSASHTSVHLTSQFTQLLLNHLRSAPDGSLTTKEDFRSLFNSLRSSPHGGSLRGALQPDDEAEPDSDSASDEPAGGNNGDEASNSSAIPGTDLGVPGAHTASAKPPRGSSGKLPWRRPLPQWDVPGERGEQL